MSHTSPNSSPKVLLSGLAMPEMARWHVGRLWFAHWNAGEIVAVDMKGKSEVITNKAPAGFGWSIDWLPDGSLLVSGKDLMRMEKDGSLVRHADLRSLSEFGWSDMVVDGRGNIYINSINFDLLGRGKPESGIIALITPDGKARKVADGLALPNGTVISPDNETLIVAESLGGRLTAFDIAADGSLSNRRVWAEGRLGPDGICMDAEGAIWVQGSDIRAATHREDSPEGVIYRIHEGGEVLQRIEHDKTIFSVTLGGPDGKTLFMLATEFHGAASVKEMADARVGEVVISKVSVPGAGWP